MSSLWINRNIRIVSPYNKPLQWIDILYRWVKMEEGWMAACKNFLKVAIYFKLKSFLICWFFLRTNLLYGDVEYFKTRLNCVCIQVDFRPSGLSWLTQLLLPRFTKSKMIAECGTVLKIIETCHLYYLPGHSDIAAYEKAGRLDIDDTIYFPLCNICRKLHVTYLANIEWTFDWRCSISKTYSLFNTYM